MREGANEKNKLAPPLPPSRFFLSKKSWGVGGVFKKKIVSGEKDKLTLYLRSLYNFAEKIEKNGIYIKYNYI